MFSVRPVSNFQELLEAFVLTHEQYCRAGYMQKNESRLRFFLRDLLPTATALVAVANHKVIGTATAVKLGIVDLPSSSIFPEEIKDLLIQGRSIAEGTKFACTQCLASEARGAGKMSVVGTELLRWLFTWCRANRIRDWLIVINPKVEDFYRRELGFEVISKALHCQHVEGNPGTLMRLDIEAQVRERASLSKTASEVFFGADLPWCLLEQSYQPTAEEVMLLVVSNPELLSRADRNELRALCKFYPHLARIKLFRPEIMVNSLMDSRHLLLNSFSGILPYNATFLPVMLKRSCFALRAYFAAICAVLEVRAAHWNVAFDCVIADDIPDGIISDPVMLGRLFAQIVESAIACSRPGDCIKAFLGLEMQSDAELGILFCMNVPLDCVAPATSLQAIDLLGGKFMAHEKFFSYARLLFVIPVARFEHLISGLLQNDLAHATLHNQVAAQTAPR